MKTLKFVLCGVLGWVSLAAMAANIEVKMLTQGTDGQALVFEPMFVKANVGDAITFKPMQKAGHTSISILVPEGAKSWKAKPDTEITVKLDKQGVYLVECDMHKTMGMVAVIQAGKAVNLEAARKKAQEESAKMLVGKDRFAKALDKVK